MAVFNLHGVASVPADNGTNATTTITITPPTLMATGDLVVVYLQQRGTATFSVNNTGGQTWTSIGRNATTANVALETYWARFNGTWSANPIFQFSAGTNTSAQMLVFRSDVPTNQWGTESIVTTNAAAAATITITGLTPANPDSVTVGSWMTADDNTWGNLTGVGWSKLGLTAQYRNLAGNDQSSTYAYYLQTGGPSPIPNTSQQQLTLGNDATAWRRITFYNFAAAAYTPVDPYGMMGFFGM